MEPSGGWLSFMFSLSSMSLLSSCSTDLMVYSLLQRDRMGTCLTSTWRIRHDYCPATSLSHHSGAGDAVHVDSADKLDGRRLLRIIVSTF